MLMRGIIRESEDALVPLRHLGFQCLFKLFESFRLTNCLASLNFAFSRWLPIGTRADCLRHRPSVWLLVLLPCLVGACNWIGNPLERAREHLAKGALAAARIDAGNAIQKDSNDSEAYLLLGQILTAQGEFNTADRTLRKAAELGADKARIDAVLAHVLLKTRAYKRILSDLNPGPTHEGETLAIVLAARGHAQLAFQQPEAAKASFENALNAFPDLPEAVIGQAHLAFMDKDPARAMDLVERAIAKAPRHAQSWDLKAQLLRLQSKTEEAIAAYERAASVDPASVLPRLAAAELLADAGRFDAAQTHVDQVRRVSPNWALGHHAQALLHYRQKRYDKALEVLQLALKAQPNYVPSMLLIGMTHLALGNLKQAEERFRLIVQARPDDWFTRKLYATTLIRLGSTKGAIDTLARALEKQPDDPELLTLAAEAHARARDFTKATAYFEQVARLRPNDPVAIAHLGLVKYAAGDTEPGLAALEKAGAFSEEDTGADIALTMVLLERKDYKKALAAAQRIQSKQPQNPIGFNLAGMALSSLEEKDAARKSYELAAALDPGYWPAAANLADLDLAAGKREVAKQRIERMLAQQPDRIEAMMALVQLTGDRGQFVASLESARRADMKALQPRLVLARAYIVQGLGDRALSVAQEAVAIAPDRAEPLEVLGAAQLAANRKSEALSTLRQLATIVPTSTAVHTHLAQIQAALGDATGAENAYKKALSIKPDDPAAMTGLAILHASRKRFGEAMILAERLKQRYPKSPLGNVVTGDLLVSQKKYPEAVKAYDDAMALGPSGTLVIRRHEALKVSGQNPGHASLAQWLTTYPNDLDVRLYLANQYYLAERFPDAIGEYQRIVKADPHRPVALNNLASAYLKSKDPRAMHTAEAAYKLNPDDADILDTLGVALTQNGQAERAIEILRKAMARNPDSAESRMHYALALAKSGEKTAARMELQKLVASGKAVTLDAEAKALLASQ